MIIDTGVGMIPETVALIANESANSAYAWGATIVLIITSLTTAIVTIINTVRGKQVRTEVREVKEQVQEVKDSQERVERHEDV